MGNRVSELEKKVNELEEEVEIIKSETAQALRYMAENFNQELNQLMTEYRNDLKNEVISALKNYKQQ